MQPSIQKLVTTFAQECSAYLSEEAPHTDAYVLAIDRVESALQDLEAEFTPSWIDQMLLSEAKDKTRVRVKQRAVIYGNTVGTRPTSSGIASCYFRCRRFSKLLKVPKHT